MMISYRYKFIFVHNKKVAGSSIKFALRSFGIETPIIDNHAINRALEPFWVFRFLNRKQGLLFLPRKKIPPQTALSRFNHHDSAAEIKRKIPDEIWNNFFKFGFVRNPWDWQVSLYFYLLKTRRHFQHELVRSMRGFDEYIEWRVNEEKHLQKDFFYDKKGNRLVDFIGKFENLEEDFQKAYNEIGIKAELPHLNKSQHNSYREYYDAYTRDLIADHFREDIKLFEYEF